MPKKKPDVESGTVAFDFDDDAEALVFDLSKVSDDILRNLAIHGASQKIGDSYAGAKSATDGTGIDPNEWSRSQAESVISQLYEGKWIVRVPGEGAVTDLAVALSEVTGATMEEATDRLKDASKDEKKALRAHPDIAAVLARIKRERAEKKEKELASKAGTGPDLTAFLTGASEA